MLRDNKVKICVMFSLLVVAFFSGCATLGKIGLGMKDIGDAGKDVGNYIPVYGQIVTAISGIVSMAGAGIYHVASKRRTAIQTLVESIKYAKENEIPVKDAVKTVAEIKGVGKYIDKWAQIYDPKPKKNGV